MCYPCLNKSADCLNKWNSSNDTEWSRGLDEYASDEELALVPLFNEYPDPLMKFAAACCFLFIIIGILGNFITIFALAKYKKVRNATAIFIINLSVSDLLFAMIILPIIIAVFLNKSWTTGRIMCQIFSTLNYWFSATSVFTIVAITVNRYVMVSHPVLYPKLYQTKNLTIIIIAIWVGSFVMLTPILFQIWGRLSLDQNEGFCTIIPDKNCNSPKTLLIVMEFAVPSFIIIVCYSRIMYLVKKSKSKASYRPPISKVQSNSNSPNQDICTRELTSSGDTQEEDTVGNVMTNTSGALTKFKNNFKATFRKRQRRMSYRPTRRDKRLQTMIIAIMISFFTCHIPIIITNTANRNFALGPYGSIMSYLLKYLTVCSNPIIYVVMSKEYRQAYSSIFK